jgi:hypothetical protein
LPNVLGALKVMAYTQLPLAGIEVAQVNGGVATEKLVLVVRDVTGSAFAVGLVIVTACAALVVSCETKPKPKLAGDAVGAPLDTVTFTKPLTIFADASSLVTIFDPTAHTPVMLELFKSKLNVHELEGAKEGIPMLALIEPGKAVISGKLHVELKFDGIATCSCPAARSVAT